MGKSGLGLMDLALTWEGWKSLAMEALPASVTLSQVVLSSEDKSKQVFLGRRGQEACSPELMLWTVVSMCMVNDIISGERTHQLQKENLQFHGGRHCVWCNVSHLDESCQG